mmetsp:Transcript_36388/g.53382  ORF Transcript_36388/g.53382 Transcript_36388/m.53382 type:complete len:191 (-) Transcript_36388:187-759(-)
MNRKDTFGLQALETSGWIVQQDPFGWFQWYCRFYVGRRSLDDDRQIARWQAMCGAKGRWKRNLIARCVREGKTHDDISCSPVVRQTLQHWAYRLTEAHHSEYKTQIAAGAKTAFIPASSMPPIESPIDLPQDVGATAGRGSEVRRTKTKIKSNGSGPSTKILSHRRNHEDTSREDSEKARTDSTCKRPRL